jgi:hypothetical protein
MAFAGENIRFEVDGEQLRYFEKNKLSDIFNINNCNFRYYIKNDSHGADYINLYITRHEDPENEICIDCEPLGEGKFLEMFNLIGNNDIVKMEAVKKEKSNEF